MWNNIFDYFWGKTNKFRADLSRKLSHRKDSYHEQLGSRFSIAQIYEID
jgi:hypothetical protein